MRERWRLDQASRDHYFFTTVIDGEEWVHCVSKHDYWGWPSTQSMMGKSAAEVCRFFGWQVGDRIVGDEGYGPTVLRITAIGERDILARPLSGPGADTGHEGRWVLWCRDWRRIGG